MYRKVINKFLLYSGLRFVITALSGFRQRVEDFVIRYVITQKQTIHHNGVDCEFAVPNGLSRYRIATFSTKEPETLEWIDKFPRGAILWDIGANVGLYSIYAAKQRASRVYAFEPSVFNLELLARNLFLNDLQQTVSVIPLALSNRLGIDLMRMTTTNWAGALSSFGSNLSWDGKPIKSEFEFSALGVTADQAVMSLKLPQPQFIKMDVDGNEHIILEGARRTLLNVEQILLEINEDYQDQAVRSSDILSEVGLRLQAKRQSPLMAKSKHGYKNTFNQIWVRT